MHQVVLIVAFLGFEADTDLFLPVVDSFDEGVRSAAADFVFDLLDVIEEIEVSRRMAKVAIVMVGF